jgi:UDP-N-acetylmuramate--alanine ligase
VIGGKVLDFGTNARVGQGEYIVFEADESDGSFVKLLPTIGVVTNIDADHMDHYKYLDGLKDAFLTYINAIPFYGYSLLCIDDPIVREILPQVDRPYYTYGISEDADYRAADIEIGRFSIRLFGNHNVVNSLSVIAVALELGLSPAVISEAIAVFRGVGRRLELIGEHAGVSVYDDYGHHPTEIRATLDALKMLGRRVVVVFQPHRYSRTQLLWDDFGQSFANADELFLAEVYPAGEQPIPGVSSDLIRQSVEKREGRRVEVICRFEDIASRVANAVREGDIVLTLGAGDICKAAPRILEGIKIR